MKTYYLIVRRKDLYLLQKNLKGFFVTYVETIAIKDEFVLVIIDIRQIDLIVVLSTLRIGCRFLDPLLSFETYKKVYKVDAILELDIDIPRVKAKYSWFENIMADRENISPIHSGYYLLLPNKCNVKDVRDNLKETVHCNDVMKSLGLYLFDEDLRESLPTMFINAIKTIKNKELFNLKDLTIEQVEKRNNDFFTNVIKEFINKAKFSYSYTDIAIYLDKILNES